MNDIINEFDMPSDLDMPLGLGMALAQNLPAMNHFTNLPPEKQKKIIERTHNLNSKSEMRAFVASLEPKN